LKDNVAETTKQDLEFLQRFEPDVFWEQHGKKVLIGLGALILIGLAAFYRQRQSAEQQEAASAELARATDPAALERIAQSYRGKPLAAQALLRMAEQQAEKGQYKAAEATFQRFLQEFPRHEMVASAKLGLAAMQEAQGNFEAAKSQYQQLAASSPTGYAAVPARLGVARCADALGQVKEAQQAYEELRPMIQGSPWETEVYIRSMVLGRSQTASPTNAPAEQSLPVQLPAPQP
jgi:TolA-binding protein